MPRDPQPDWVLKRRQIIGRRIRDAREDAELTQEQLGEAAGVGWQSIHRIEYGTSDPSLSVLLRISNAVGVPIDVLLRPDAGRDSQS